MQHFHLRRTAQPQTYALGLKEVWRVAPHRHRPGLVQHSVGWPLQQSLMAQTFGGGFMYHMDDDLVHVGLVVGLDYKDPYLNP